MRRLSDIHTRVDPGMSSFPHINCFINVYLLLIILDDVTLDQPDENGATRREGYFERILREAAKTLSRFTQQVRGGQVLEDVCYFSFLFLSFSLSFFKFVVNGPLQECSICMDDKPDYVARPCGHRYCKRCYAQVAHDRQRVCYSNNKSLM